MHAVERELAAICGAGFVRAAGAADTVGGTGGRWVAGPGTLAGLMATIRVAVERDLTVVPRGAGTKLDWGAAPTGVDLLLDTGRLAGVWHHSPAERVAEVGAGTPLRAAQARLARSGQRIALDPASADATVGGVIAADEAGPLAHRFGRPQSQVLGISFVRADGALSHSGGQSRERTAEAGALALLCGSYGTLGVLTSLTLRLQPLPPTRMWVCRSVWTPLEVHDLVREVMSAGLDPSGIEFDLPAAAPGLPPGPPGARAGRGAGTVAILLEGGAAAVEEEAVIAQSLLGGRATRSATPPGWWRRYPFGPTDIALRLAASPPDLHAAIYALRDAAGVAVPVRGSAGLGVVHAALPGSVPAERAAEIIDAVRGVLVRRGGRCLVLSAPPPVRAAVDLWGNVADLPLQRQIKERFDPQHRFSPGRYVGGL
jgi:glycolate oxidase FAD binding subunit